MIRICQDIKEKVKRRQTIGNLAVSETDGRGPMM